MIKNNVGQSTSSLIRIIVGQWYIIIKLKYIKVRVFLTASVIAQRCVYLALMMRRKNKLEKNYPLLTFNFRRDLFSMNLFGIN